MLETFGVSCFPGPGLGVRRRQTTLSYAPRACAEVVSQLALRKNVLNEGESQNPALKIVR